MGCSDDMVCHRVVLFADEIGQLGIYRVGTMEAIMLPKDKFFARLLLALTVLGMSVSVWSATVYPLYFNDVSTLDTATQNRYWDNLMKYKLWGTTGINLTDEGEVILEDVTGYSGTASGDIKFGHDYSLGGPILSGGIVEFRHFSGANMLEGPLRSLKGAKYPAWSQTDLKTARFDGPYCINGEITGAGADNDNTFQVWESLVSNGMYYGDNYDFCPDKVPAIDTLLSVPELPLTGVTWEKGIYADVYSPVHYLHVPPDSIYKNEYGTFDKYIENLVVSATPDFKLYVLMPPEGRLTRIFVKEGFNIDNSAHEPVIQVVYVNEGTHFDKSKMEWDLTDKDDFTYVSNQQYAGNLLFYTNKNVNWGSTDHPSYQGSFITTGSFYIGNDFTIAGQIISNYLEIRAPFKGDFKYVPFDPPILDPTAIAKGKFVESSKDTLLPISLDKKTSTNVSFKYCFALKPSSETRADTTSIEDLDYDKAVLSKMPICSGDTVFAEVKIAAGSKEPQAGYEVYLNAKKDGLTEGVEILPLYVFDMLGAVFPGNKRNGTFYLNIYDGDPPVFDNDDKDPYGINENTVTAKVAKDSVIKIINLKNVDSKTMDELAVSMEPYGTSPTGVPSANDLFSFNIITDPANGTAYTQISVKNDTLLDYEKTAPDYVVVLKLIDGDGFVLDTIIRTISVIDVNELPIVEEQTFTINENSPIGTPVDPGKVVYTEPDTAAKYSNDVYIAVGGDTAVFVIDSITGIITNKMVLDYEVQPTTYTLLVKVRDKADTSIWTTQTMTINLLDVNEKPTITTDTLYVQDKKVGNVEADDPDKNDTKTFTLVEDKSGCFAVAPDGSVSVSETCKGVNATASEFVITVKVTDSGDSIDTKNIIVRVVPPTIVVTDSTWIHPSTPIYTNKENFRYCWILNDVKDNENCADTTLKPGENTVCKEINEKDGLKRYVKDCFKVYYSKEAPVVTVVADVDEVKAGNVFTIVEKTDESDTNFYVNKQKNDIRITVKDPSDPSSDTSFTISVDFTKQQVSVPQKSYDDMAKVAKESVIFDESNLTRTPMNGTVVKESYTTKVAGIEVTVSRTTDNKGEPILQPVKNAKGKVENIEVMTVSYVTKIDGKDVTISYLADAKTGSALAIDGDGNLMTTDAKDAKSAGSFKVSYDYIDSKGNKIEMSYYVDKSGNMVKTSAGDKGYALSYTYVNKYGNAATQSIFVVLDQTPPTVQIISPTKGQVIRANFVDVTWEINGKKQDTLTVQGLEKGPNAIVRFYRDKAGNEASDTVMVVMKGSKDIEISVVEPVTVISKTKVEKYYDEHPLEKGQTYAVSIYNNAKGGEQETMIGGNFKAKETGSSDTIPGHLGPTLALDVKLPVLSGVSGLATFDDMVNSNGRIPSIGVTINPDDLDENAKKDYKEFTVDEYVQQFCDEGYNPGSDYSRANLYDTKLTLKIWVYTTLGNFVNYFTFTQELNDPDFTDEAGMLKLFFEMKPNKDGYVVAKNGKQIGTGSYVYKVEAKMKSKAKCATPPLDMKNLEKDMTRRDVRNEREDLLKPFGYKRPSNK